MERRNYSEWTIGTSSNRIKDGQRAYLAPTDRKFIPSGGHSKGTWEVSSPSK